MSRPWMPLYVSDYLGDTGHLTTIEHGAYMLLIMHYWQNRSLPKDERRLATICRVTQEQWEGMRDVLAELFDEDWTHHRVDTELALAEQMISKRSAAGKAGASGRYGKRTANAQQTDSLSPSPKQDTSSLRSEGTPSAVPAEAIAPEPDARTDLFRTGLSRLVRLTGIPERTARPMIGRWLKLCGDDCLAVSRAIEDATIQRPADPRAWIEAHFKQRPTGPPSRRAANGYAEILLESRPDAPVSRDHDPEHWPSGAL